MKTKKLAAGTYVVSGGGLDVLVYSRTMQGYGGWRANPEWDGRFSPSIFPTKKEAVRDAQRLIAKKLRQMRQA